MIMEGNHSHQVGLQNMNVNLFLPVGELNAGQMQGVPTQSFLMMYLTMLSIIKRNNVNESHQTVQNTPDRRPTSLQCNFEDTCSGWFQNESNPIKWIKNEKPDLVQDARPHVDHTMQTSEGHFAYINGLSGRVGRSASLFSPNVYLDDYPQYCLKFWYHMRGRAVSFLNVTMNLPSSNQTERGIQYLIFSRRGLSTHSGTEWTQARINIFSPLGLNYTSPIYFEFRATIGFFPTSQIAIDDISLTKGVCQGSVFDIRTLDTNNILPNLNLTSAPVSNPPTPERSAPCHEGSYNPETQTCCRGRLYRRKGFCCGKHLLTSSGQKCCNESPYSPGNLIGCCGNKRFFTFFQGCCNNAVYFKLRDVCNNGVLTRNM